MFLRFHRLCTSILPPWAVIHPPRSPLHMIPPWGSSRNYPSAHHVGQTTLDAFIPNSTNNCSLRSNLFPLPDMTDPMVFIQLIRNYYHQKAPFNYPNLLIFFLLNCYKHHLSFTSPLPMPTPQPQTITAQIRSNTTPTQMVWILCFALMSQPQAGLLFLF